MLPVPKTGRPPKIDTISLKDWLKGTVTAFDAGRTPINGLRASSNLMLDQDGTLRPRPSLVRYGTQPVGTVLGDMFEFVKMNGIIPENWIATVQNVAGTAKVYVSKDGASWQVCNGKTYDITKPCHFLQVDDKILVMNGADNLSYLNIPTLSVVPFVALTTPSAPTATKNPAGSATFLLTTFTYYYKITANSTVGETAASPSGSVQVGLQRDVWDSGNNNVNITWSAVPGAQSYNVYIGTVSGQEVLVARGINGLSWRDDGSMVTDITTPAPLGDTTAGPKVTRGKVINGQVFLTTDTDNLRYVRYGGIGQSVLDFSPFNGGGWVEVARGTKEFPVKVESFRDGRGNPQITVLCRGTNGSGKRYILSPNSTTTDAGIINFFDLIEDNGQDGTDSPDGVLLYRDALWYPSREGFKTTGTKPQLQNILSTSTVSETISKDIPTLNSQYMDKCVGLAYQQRLYWALPVGATTNNEIWVMDLQRGGAWMKPWNIAASAMTLYNDNSGTTHFLILSNNVIYELTQAQATMDDTIAFPTNATSGFLKATENGLDWMKIIDVTFVLLRPQGSISFSISGRTEDGQLAGLGQGQFDPSASIAGWSEAGWGGFGWSNMPEVPTQYGDAARYITVEPDDEDEVQWLTWEMNSSGSGVDFQLADVIVRYVNIGPKDLS